MCVRVFACVSERISIRPLTHRLAALEIARFQDQLIERITSEMTAHLDGSAGTSASAASSSSTSPQMGAVMVLHPHGRAGVAPSAQYADNGADWTFARAFLYSLTVLTTVGKWRRTFCSYDFSFVFIRRKRDYSGLGGGGRTWSQRKFNYSVGPWAKRNSVHNANGLAGGAALSRGRSRSELDGSIPLLFAITQII